MEYLRSDEEARSGCQYNKWGRTWLIGDIPHELTNRTHNDDMVIYLHIFFRRNDSEFLCRVRQLDSYL